MRPRQVRMKGLDHMPFICFHQTVKKLLQSVGPAIVVAAVVLGPGSITTSTKAGAAFGYGPLWVLAVLLVLLIGTASLAGDPVDTRHFPS